jgi:hypothetical protein
MPNTRRKGRSGRKPEEAARAKADPPARRRSVEDRAPFFKRNGLSLVFLLFFVMAIVGQALAGHAQDSKDRVDHGETPQSLSAYVSSGDFVSATFENWESEFLGTSLFVVLSVYLYQRGSAESRHLNRREEQAVQKTEAEFYDDPPPRAAKAGGALQWVYEHSLSLALFVLFVMSFVFHLYGSWNRHVEEELMHEQVPHSLSEHLGDPQFWFESFQNWQSEFISIFSAVVLTIMLRHKDSPESKPMDAPNSATGK